MADYLTYRSMITVYNGLTGREDLEWSNFWYDCADHDCPMRYLLVGDSTARMVRSTFAKLTNAPCDLLGTSCAIDDELFVNQLEAFFNNSLYRYETIFLQLGHHSRIGKDGKPYTEVDYAKFEHDFIELCRYLAQYCKKLVVETVFMSVMPFERPKPNWTYSYRIRRKLGLVKEPQIMELSDEDANRVKRRKNSIIEKVTLDNKYTFLDLSSFMEAQKMPHVDHIHYVEEAKPVIVNEMIKFM